ELGHAAGGVDGVAKQHQLGVAGGNSLGGPNLAPGGLGVIQDKGNKLDHGLLLLVPCMVRLAGRGAGGGHGITCQQGQKIAFENQTQDEQAPHAAQPQVYAAYLKPATAAAFVAAIFNVV